MPAASSRRQAANQAAEYGLDLALMATMKPSINLSLSEDAPDWLSHIQVTRDGDEIEFDIVKRNGLSYGHAKLSLVDFNKMADLLLDP